MTDKPDAPAPLFHDRTLRDRIWQPVRNSGWLVLLAAALGGGLIGVMANPFPAWCNAPEEAHIVCAREWVSAFGGYFGGVLTLVAAWIAFGPAKRATELQEIQNLNHTLKLLRSDIDNYIEIEEEYIKLLKFNDNKSNLSQGEYIATHAANINKIIFKFRTKIIENTSAEYRNIQHSLMTELIDLNTELIKLYSMNEIDWINEIQYNSKLDVFESVSKAVNLCRRGEKFIYDKMNCNDVGF